MEIYQNFSVIEHEHLAVLQMVIMSMLMFHVLFFMHLTIN